MFTQPDGLAMLWRGTSIADAVVASVSAVVGITALVAGVGGYLLRPTNLGERVLLIIGGLLLLFPGVLADFVGIGLFALAAATQLARRPRTPAAVPAQAAQPPGRHVA